jgi:hypothetical protein
VETGKILRSFVALAVLFGIAIMWAPGASAQEAEATITIHKAECFTGVGADIFEECHDQGVGDVAFEVNGDVFVADSTGVLDLEGPAGTVTITEDPAVFGAYLGAYVYCRDLTDNEVLFDGSATDSGGTVVLEVEVGDEIVCDWYNITEAPAGGTDGGTTGGGTTSSGGSVTALPATGVGTGTSGAPMAAFALVGGLLLLGLGMRRRTIG